MHLHIYSYAVSTPSKLWRPSLYSKELEVRILKMPDYSQFGTSVTKYDSIQDDLDTLAAMDDLLAGGEISQLYTYVTIWVEILVQGHCSSKTFSL